MKTLLVLALALAGIGGAASAQTAAPARDCQLRIDPQSTQWVIAAYDPSVASGPPVRSRSPMSTMATAPAAVTSACA